MEKNRPQGKPCRTNRNRPDDSTLEGQARALPAEFAAVLISEPWLVLSLPMIENSFNSLNASLNSDRVRGIHAKGSAG